MEQPWSRISKAWVSLSFGKAHCRSRSKPAAVPSFTQFILSSGKQKCSAQLPGPKVCRFRFSLVNLRQRVAKLCFPPPLAVTRRTQGTQNSGEQQPMNRASSSWKFIISRHQESTRSTITTVARLLWTGSEEPARSKITLYYWLHTMIIMQFTGLLSIHFTSLFFRFSFL